jgi:hypothetical protein
MSVACTPIDLWAHGPIGVGRASGWAKVEERLAATLAALRRPVDARTVSAEGFTYLKLAAIERHRSLVTNLTGEVGWRTLRRRELVPLCAAVEVFLPAAPEEVASHPGAADARGAAAPATSRAAPRAEPVERVPPADLLPEVDDRYQDDRLPGAVVGSTGADGARRLGVDAEGAISVGDGRLRLEALRLPGWGRQSVSYGPFRRRPGLAFGARLLHSHLNAHTDHAGLGRRKLVAGLLRHGPGGSLVPDLVVDSLAAGFHAAPVPSDPVGDGHALVVHAAGVVNGALRATVGGRSAHLHEGIQDVRIDCFVVLRERGAIYYTSSVPGAAGHAPHPWMRPLAIDPGEQPGEAGRAASTVPSRAAGAAAGQVPCEGGPARGCEVVYAGVHQAVHGEGGHEAATTVDGVRVRHVPSLAAWYTSALEADRLNGGGRLEDRTAVRGGTWRVLNGRAQRGEGGLSAARGVAALIGLDQPAGLVHVVVHTTPTSPADARVGLLWRCDPIGAAGWRVEVGRDEAELCVRDKGRWQAVAAGPVHLPAAHVSSLQVLDDGHRMTVHLDGHVLFGGPVHDDRHAGHRHVGLLVGARAALTLRDFEAHPRRVRIPAELDAGAPWHRRGARLAWQDRFDRPPGELGGGGARPAGQGLPAPDSAPGAGWQRSLGPGRFELTGEGSVRVAATREAPNPGRTIYTVAWDDPGFADLEVGILPPGRARSQGHGSRGGLVFWQDEANYVVTNVWLDDSPDHNGSAVSLFFRSRGVERTERAVWTNVARKITWGTRCVLRAAGDGDELLVWLDGEPVLQRRTRDLYPDARRLTIRRVGLVANREWGDDTGTVFDGFTARTDPVPGGDRPPARRTGPAPGPANEASIA